MAVNIEIKHNQKEISVEDISSLMNLSYGISNDNYCLNLDKVGEYTILYDHTCIGRGIEVSRNEENICLRLPLPTSFYEINMFYELTKKLCEKLGENEFIRDEEIVSLKDVYVFLEPDQEASVNAIRDITEKTKNGEMSHFYIFGVMNPISLGKREIQEINGSLDLFERLLNRLQQLDVYYASPALYQRHHDQSIFGVYCVGEEIDSVVPIRPYVLFNNDFIVDSYFVMLPEDNAIMYDDFINHVEKIGDYDSQHIIVSLSEEKIEELVNNYSVNLTTKQREESIYKGKKFDSGENHSYKIKQDGLELDEIVGYNHLAIYLRWCVEHNLVSDYILERCPGLKENDLRELIRSHELFDGSLRSFHFNSLGKKFTKQFYQFNQGTEDYYPHCVDAYALEYFGEDKYNCDEFQDEAYLFVPFDENYYQCLSQYIEKTWHKFMQNN